MFGYFMISCLIFELVYGHGMVMDPVNRASRWRVDSSALINYNDNELFCGGRAVQWEQNGGKCGLCGDNYANSMPRNHELNGKFGQGVIVKNYTSGRDLPVEVLITANHLGYFEFHLCDLDSYEEESDDCFNALKLAQYNGDTKYHIGRMPGRYNVTLQIPERVECNHCVLQWTYTTGNTWGVCQNGTGALGCGPQETFRTCSDISIFENNDLFAPQLLI